MAQAVRNSFCAAGGGPPQRGWLAAAEDFSTV